MHSPKRIVHVDDDPDDRLLLSETLPEGYELRSLESGRALLEYLKSLSAKDLPFLVLLDINMPEMDGWETLQQLRACSCFDKLQVIIFTTASRDILKADMQRFHVPVITKPFNYSGLHQCWRAILATVAFPSDSLL